MTTYIVRPNSVRVNGGNTSPAAQATVLSYLSDNSDATVVTNPGTGQALWAFGLSAPTIAANDFVARIGWSMRWKGNAAGNYSIGTQLYTGLNSNPPGYYATLTPNNSAAFTTTQLAYIAKEWTLSEVATLNLAWYDGRSNAAWGVTEHADIWASVYALTKATATPQNRTETVSVYPTISVDTTATIDWESSSLDWQNLRKVTVEVRIESGGTTIGTGTLMSQSSASTMFTATGTKTVTVTLPDALANGTYNIYARALRYREDGIVRDDQNGAWSSAATLTMSAPMPVTPTLTVTADQELDRALINVTPIASTGYSGPYVFVERSSDSGITWTPVRGASGVQANYGVASSFYDYELPRIQGVSYRAKVEATYSGLVNASPWSSSVNVVINADTWNLKAPETPANNVIGVNVVGKPSEQITEDQAVFRPLGRQYPVVVSGSISGWDGQINVTTSTAGEWEILRTLIEAQAVVLLESIFGWSKYVRILSGTQSAQFGTQGTPVRNTTITYVQVQQPTVVVGQSQATQNIPTLIDGGNATATFDGSYDGGSAYSTYTVTFDGGGAA